VHCSRSSWWIVSATSSTVTGARIWGPSARFEGQQVGRQHELHDGDTVEVLTR
jgi:ribosome-interacting GTPase 1